MDNLKVTSFDTAKLIPDPNNARLHDRRNIDAIKQSIQRFGIRKPIVAHEASKIVYAGNGVLVAALELGIPEIPVAWIPADTPPEVAKAYSIYDNRTTDLSSFDPVKLDNLLAEIPDINLDELLWTPVELDELLNSVQADKEETFDVGAAVEAETTPVTKTGDVWLCGKHRVMAGDSTKVEDVEKLMNGEKADFLAFDPPYGIGLDKWDKAIDSSRFFHLSLEYLKNDTFVAFFSQMPTMFDWLKAIEKTKLTYKDHIVWIKRTPTGITQDLLRSHESLFIYCFGNSEYIETRGKYTDIKLPGILFDIVSIEAIDRYISSLHHKIETGLKDDRMSGGRHAKVYDYLQGIMTDRSPEYVNFTNVWSFLPEMRVSHDMTLNPETASPHPTMKPVLLMERLVCLCSKEKALLYDPFLGSGTTLIACKKTGRRCVGMEISPHYVDVCCQRFYDFTGIVPILESTNEPFKVI